MNPATRLLTVPGPVTGIAVIAHPHPRHGGTREVKSLILRNLGVGYA